MMDFSTDNLDNMTTAEFEEFLPELIVSGNGSISDDPRFARFFAANPDCAALVRDLETIAQTAKDLFEPIHEPSESVWTNIASKIKDEPKEPGKLTGPDAGPDL